MILHDLCILPAQFHVLIIMRYLESHVHLTDRCAYWKFINCSENLFCKPCNFKRWEFVAKSHVGQAEAITELISALWRTSLMLTLNCSLLNR
jgi:hypothetical protein